MNADSLVTSWLSGPWISQLSLHTHRRLRGLRHLSSPGSSGRESERGLASESGCGPGPGSQLKAQLGMGSVSGLPWVVGQIRVLVVWGLRAPVSRWLTWRPH